MDLSLFDDCISIKDEKLTAIKNRLRFEFGTVYTVQFSIFFFFILFRISFVTIYSSSGGENQFARLNEKCVNSFSIDQILTYKL